MIVVIQCAASKQLDAGHLLSASGKPVIFVANPRAAPADPAHEYARPDDLNGMGMSWRQVLQKYNAEAGENPLNLCPAYQLYQNKIYGRLVDRFGLQKIYILSAGWGLIRSDFLTPYYDITFSQGAEPYKRRRRTDLYADFHMQPDITDEDIVFFGGKGYLPLFGKLTKGTTSRSTVFYNSTNAPEVNGCALVRFETTVQTNWHYQCAKAFIDGALGTR